MHSDRINSTKIQTGTQQNISSFILSVYVISSFFQNNLFLHYVLILSQIDPKWFCLWGKQREKWELLSQEDKKKNLSSRFFKVPWQQNIQRILMRTAGKERLITRETIYYFNSKGNTVWLRTHTQSLCCFLHLNHSEKNTAFLPHRDPSVRGWESAVIVLWHGDEGLRLEPGRQRLF